MRSFGSRTVFVRSCVVLLLIAGCKGDADKDHSPIVTPHESGLLPPKKANLPDLPNGAGPIDKDAPDEFTPTPSGLYYRILRKGGRRKPFSYETVLVNYRGWLDDGHTFDSSYDKGQPASFPVNKVVPGFTEGLQIIGIGGMIELEIPPRLGYGAAGQPGAVPPNSTLHFIVELKEIEGLKDNK